MKLKLIAVTPAKQKSVPKNNEIAEIGIKIDTNITKLEKIFADHGQVYDSAKDYSWLDIYETINNDPVYVDSVLAIINEVKELKAREAKIFEDLASKIIEDCDKSREDEAEEASNKSAAIKKDKLYAKRAQMLESISINNNAIDKHRKSIDTLEAENQQLRANIAKIEEELIESCNQRITFDRSPDPEANPVESKEELDGDTEGKAPKVRCYIIENSIPRELIIDLLRIFANF